MVFPHFLPDWFVVTLLLTVGPTLLFAFAYLLLRIGEALAAGSGNRLVRLLTVLVMASVPPLAFSSLWSVLGELYSPMLIITTVIAYAGGVVLVANWFGDVFAPNLKQGHFDQAMAEQIEAIDEQTKTIVEAIDRLAEVGRERDERMLSVLSEVLEELRAQRTGNDVSDVT